MAICLKHADPETLARYIVAVMRGMAVEAASGAKGSELHQIVDTAMRGVAGVEEATTASMTLRETDPRTWALELRRSQQTTQVRKGSV